MGSCTDRLLHQLEFYAKYHQHPVNKAIHFVFVPTICWSVLVWFSLIPWTAASVGGVPISVPTLALAAYAIFYTAFLDPVAGGLWTCIVGIPMCWSALAFATTPNAWAWALGLHVFSWYMQIHPGHAIFEKRKPALMDSLVQAFAMAPLFVWLELLFLLGYRPDFRRELEKRVAKATNKNKAL